MQCSIFIHFFETCFSCNSIYWKLFNTSTQKVSSFLIPFLNLCMGFPGSSDGKESACNVGDLGSIPGLGRSPGEGKGYPLQYSGLENSINREARQATAHGVMKSQTRLKWLRSTSPCSWAAVLSVVQQSDSVIQTHMCFFQIICYHKLLQNIEYSSLCYTVGPVGCLLYIVAGRC